MHFGIMLKQDIAILPMKFLKKNVRKSYQKERLK